MTPLVLAFTLLAAATPLTPPELRGRELYLRGGETLRASFDDWATTAPANAVPCASCHGNDGRGRAEGGSIPSDITSASLRRPYTVTTESGRTHGPYDDRSLKKAITLGVDPAGNRLDSVMPRYAMPQRDWEDLLAFLRKLGSIADPGVSDTTLKLGVLLPPHDALPEVTATVRATASAFVHDVNERGGIFGRTIEVAFCEQTGTPADRAAAFARCAEDVFAFAGSFTDGAERELAAIAEEKETPLLASVATNPRSSIAPGRYSREVLAGLIEQTAALVRVAGAERPKRDAALVVSHDPRLADVRDAVVGQLRDEGFMSVATAKTLEDPVRADLIVLLDSRAAAHALTSLAEPLLLIPAAYSGKALMTPALRATTLVSVPMLPHDQSDAAMAIYKKLVPEPKHRAAELATLSSLSIAVDALSRAGRTLTRDAFLDAIDATTRHATGFTPQLTFRRDRHIGSTGCHVVMLRPGQPARTLWVDPIP
ncbi:MAG TPA: ABC transporter substrate-binding protein [Thermoanaerobaculia bacterium]|nr:ABC transporter substrate-binding protein [Thermoanaerobaculia bacterium]